MIRLSYIFAAFLMVLTSAACTQKKAPALSQGQATNIGKSKDADGAKNDGETLLHFVDLKRVAHQNGSAICVRTGSGQEKEGELVTSSAVSAFSLFFVLTSEISNIEKKWEVLRETSLSRPKDSSSETGESLNEKDAVQKAINEQLSELTELKLLRLRFVRNQLQAVREGAINASLDFEVTIGERELLESLVERAAKESATYESKNLPSCK